MEIGSHQLDLLAFGEIVVELKTARTLKDVHFAVVRSYLRALGRAHGLLLNFSTPTLTVRRVIAKRDFSSEALPGFLGS